MLKFYNPNVEAVFDAYRKDVRENLLILRAMIFDTAATTTGVGKLEETLKWGQPSYLTPVTKSGSTIRIDKVKSAPDEFALYFHCQTNLVETFRELFGDDLNFQGNRAVIFSVKHEIPLDIVRHCIGLALTYHLHKKVTAQVVFRRISDLQ